MIQSLVKTKVLGVDIGLEKTTYAIVDVRGNILAKDSFLTQDYPNFNTFLSVFCERAINMIMSNGEYEEIRSMGVSAPSANLLTGNIEYSGNLPWQGEIPLSAVLRDRLGLAAAVANDAHVRALGESTYGCAHGMKDFIYLTLGHGIGSCIFSNGHAHLGSNGFGGEIGHCCIYPGGRQCTCGSRGCLEAYCGANGIVQTAKEMMAESDQPSLMREQAELTPKLIAELCDQGDEMAIEVFRRTGFILGIALANYASVINPEAIILSGGIAKAGEWLLKPLNDSFEEHVFHNIENKVKFMYSTLNDEERNVLGASALAWSVKEYSLFK
jgi:glucokinase